MDHPDTPAQDLHRQGEAALSEGDYAQAEQCLRQAVALFDDEAGTDEENLACTLNDLADLRCAQGRYDAESEALYRRAAEVFERTAGPEHSDVANILNNLAALYQARGQYTEAEAVARRALAIVDGLFEREGGLGEVDENTAALTAQIRQQSIVHLATALVSLAR